MSTSGADISRSAALDDAIRSLTDSYEAKIAVLQNKINGYREKIQAYRRVIKKGYDSIYTIMDAEDLYSDTINKMNDIVICGMPFDGGDLTQDKIIMANIKAKTQELIRVGYKKIAELEGLIAAAEKEIKQLKNELEQAIEELYKKYE